MKNKIVGILIVTLLIATATFPMVGSVNEFNASMNGEVLDQHQDWSDECIYFSSEWQEFIPTMQKHIRVEVKIVQWFGGSSNLKLTIEKPLGTVLTSKELPASSIPPGICDWVSFDIPDIALTPGTNYYIVLTAPPGSEYGWGIAFNGPYLPGKSSVWPADWCFRTYCFGNNPPSNPIISGPANGKAGTPYGYDFTSTDPDGDNVSYFIKWGDTSITPWTTFQISGSPYHRIHIWVTKGAYTIEVKAKDIHGAESGWTTLPISMPKNKQYMPLGIILAFGFNVDVKIVQLEPGEDYVDLEVLNKPFYIWENEIETINSGAFIRLYSAKGLFLPSLPFCFGTCQDWGIIG